MISQEDLEGVASAVAMAGDLAQWLDRNATAKQAKIFRSKDFAAYIEATRGHQRPPAKLENDLPTRRSSNNLKRVSVQSDKSVSPHSLIALPRSLLMSQLWRGLGSGPRDLFYYLLGYSDTRTFKAVWPSAEKIEYDLNIDKRTRRKYETALERYGLVQIIGQGEQDSDGHRFKSRRFTITLDAFIFADKAAFNLSKQSDIYNLSYSSYVDLVLLDELAKRMKFTGIDDREVIHYAVHSRVYTPKLAESRLPSNVLLFPETKNRDVIINASATWRTIEKQISELTAFEPEQNLFA